MKKKISRILGVALSLALLSSLAMVAAPVIAAPGTNTWGEIALPVVAPGTDVELIATAADGTLFASVYKTGTAADDYIIYKSTDGGWTWKATKFSSAAAAINAIVCAPNWDSNDTFYVGTSDGQVYRCTDAGSATPLLLRQIVDSTTAQASVVYDMDLWTDGGSIWIMVATDIDVLVMEDSLFAEWVDMDLTISFDGAHTSQDGTPQDLFDEALVSRFATDFDQSGLIWSIIRDGSRFELETAGSGTAEWSTDKASTGNYSAKLTCTGTGLTEWAAAKIPYGDTLASLNVVAGAQVGGFNVFDISWHYYVDTAGTTRPYAMLWIDENADGTVDTRITSGFGAATPSLSATEQWVEAWTRVGTAWQLRDYDAGVISIYSGAFTGNADSFTLAQYLADAGCVNAIASYIGYGYTASAIAAYVDDITITTATSTTTYDLEPGGDAWITSTISPGQWGQVVNSVEITHDGPGSLRNEVDLDFDSYYSSTSNPKLFAAMNFDESQTGDGLFEIRGGFGAYSTIATPLEVGGVAANIDFQSIQVTGEVIMAGEYWNANVWISRNGGDTFTQAVKPPTGTGQTQVLMAPGAFDPDEGVAYAATCGPQSAFHYTNDGGDTWNQPAFVDTEIDNVLDLAFGSTILLTNDDLGSPGIQSVWRTIDITPKTPQWERVNCSQISGLDSFVLVEYSMDGSVLLLYVLNNSDNMIQKSTDNGQTWNRWRTLPSAIGAINDWVVYDGATIFAACDNGFFGTTRFGVAKQRLITETLVSIALQPGFDPSDSGNDTLVVGNNSGDAFVSADAGNTWGTGDIVGTDDVFVAFDQLDPTKVYFATSGSVVKEATIDGLELDDIANLEDSAAGTATATGFNGIWVAPDNALYAIGGDAAVTTYTYGSPRVVGLIDLTGTTATTGDVSIDAVITLGTGDFEDGEGLTIVDSDLAVDATFITIITGTIYLQGDTSEATGSIAVVIIVPLSDAYTLGEAVSVAEDGTTPLTVDILATPTTEDAEAYLFRLLLGEPYNIWETEQKDGATGIWGFEGSNFLLTVVGSELWGLEDTLSGKVEGVTVSNVGENKATVSWTHMTGARQYEVLWDTISNTVPVPATASSTPATTVTLTGLDDNTEYTVEVRVVTDKDFQSRWSDVEEFITLETIAMPDNKVPYNGMQDAPLLPSFVWLTVPNAEYYEFQLSTNPAYDEDGFTSGLVAGTPVDIDAPTTAYTQSVELAYDTDHYWIVRAVSTDSLRGIDAFSDWCFSNFHTMMEAIPPVTIEPQPTPTITVIQPTPTVIVDIPDIEVIVEPPDITVDIPQATITTVHTTIEMPEEVTPAYIWIIVAIGALLTVAVIVLIIRTRRVV